GIFIWAGQSTMETGEGGSNQNSLHQNNCSFAIFHGIKATFSSNDFSKNKLQDCHSGIWASYAYDSQFLGNTFNDNNIGLSIEHGYNNVIQNNSFFENNYGISLWENKDNFQRSSRAFNKRHSKQNQLIKIQSNTFSNVKLGISVSYGK